MVLLFWHLLYYHQQGVLAVIFILDLNNSESAELALAYLCNTAINFQMFLNNFHCILLNYTSALQHLNLLHYLFVYCLSLMQSVNGVFLSSVCLAAASAPSAGIEGIFKIYSRNIEGILNIKEYWRYTV